MKDFHQFREALNEAYSISEIAKSDMQELEDAVYDADGDEAKAAAYLVNRMNYKPREVEQMLKKFNPDIRSARKSGNSWKIKYK